jgi:hypothetical protein
MRKSFILFAIVAMLALVGCGNGLSSDFSKSGRYAFALIKSAEGHEHVLAADVTKAFAQAESDVKSDADRKTFALLKTYLQAYQYNDGTPASDGFMKVCHNSLSKVFEEGGDPTEATKECEQAHTADTNAFMKRYEEEQQKKKPDSATKK